MEIVFDIETDGLLDTMTRIHCISAYDRQSGQRWLYDPESGDLDEIIEILAEADVLLGHNIIGFDIQAVQKVRPGFAPKGRLVDTLTWSKLIWPDIRAVDMVLRRTGLEMPPKLIGSYKLEAFGYRLGILKGTFHHTTDWQEWSPQMSEYCERDVEVTDALVTKLASKGYPAEPALLEMEVARIVAEQCRNGCYFDYDRARDLETELRIRKDALVRQVQRDFHPFFKPTKEFTPKRDNAKLGYSKGARMTKLELVEFNPGSSQHIYRWLLKRGWQPTVFTDKDQVPYWIGSGPAPKIDEETLKDLPKRWPECAPLAEYQMICKRLAMLADGKAAWLSHLVKVPDGYKIHGYVDTVGARTCRMTHANPNLAQVPAVYSPYGPHCRSLFVAPPGWVMVGCDASGIEGRCLAHYMSKYDGGAYVKTILEGRKEDKTEMHWANATIIGVSRDTAKTFFYALMYGAGDAKLGSIVSSDPAYADAQKDPQSIQQLGKKSRAKFMAGLPALLKLTTSIQDQNKRNGYITGIDGRPLYGSSQHAALNTLLQACGAIVMKKALVIAEERLSREVGKENYRWTLTIHDEWQVSVRPQFADQVGETLRQCIIDAGVALKMKCPLDGEYKIGASWKDTH